MRRRIIAITIAGALLVAGGVAFATEGRGAGINGGAGVIEPIEWGDAEIVPMQSVISAGGSMSFVIKPDGSLWGSGGLRLGDGTAESKSSYIKIMDDVIAVSVAPVDSPHTMAIRADNTLWGWGSNSSRQLGDGTNVTRLSPVKIMDDVIAVSAGGNHTMAITTDGNLWGWGSNGSGRLGDSTTTSSRIPIKILDDVITVSAGSAHTMAIKTDGSLWAWGSNYHGQLGDGTTTNRSSPVKIMEDVVAVSAGSTHTMAITTDGSLWAWGSNRFNQLGDSTLHHSASVRSPIIVMEDVAAVSAGANHTMAITTNGSLWAWGDYRNGQLGDMYRPTPQRGQPTPNVPPQHPPRGGVSEPVMIMDGVVAVSAGIRHTIAIRADGSLWAWGMNIHGQLGDGTTESSSAPVRVLDSVMLPQ